MLCQCWPFVKDRLRGDETKTNPSEQCDQLSGMR